MKTAREEERKKETKIARGQLIRWHYVSPYLSIIILNVLNSPIKRYGLIE